MNFFNDYKLTTKEWEVLIEDVVRGLVTVAVFCFVAGEALGHWVHRTNDQLSALWVALVVSEEPAASQQPDAVPSQEQAVPDSEEVSALVEVELKLPPVNTLVPLLPPVDKPVSLLPPFEEVVIRRPPRKKRGEPVRLDQLGYYCA